MAVPDDIPEALKVWYNLRGFYVEKELTDFGLMMSAGLADEVRDGYRRLKPLYDYIMSLTPESDGDAPSAVSGGGAPVGASSRAPNGQNMEA